MEILDNTLALVVSIPDEPIGACKSVTAVSGYIILELSPAEVKEMVLDYVASMGLDSGIPSLAVKEWDMEDVSIARCVLTVQSFEATPPDPEEDKPEDYEWA